MNARADRLKDHDGRDDRDDVGGRPAAPLRSWRHGWRVAFAVALCAGTGTLTSGCSSTSLGAAGGAAAGAATGIVTANPAIGIGVGIAVQAATTETVNRYYRVMHTDQQNVIAALVGTMKVGDTRPWNVKHTLPIENGHGQVRVTRAFSSALADCKEFVFSVADSDEANAPEHWYTAAACQLQQDRRWWKWASAEPAVDRWGNLQ
ncbi:hypothetical protein [Paraburkholderia humisilvae]|uniref:Uncharacterized protein n=1 Tax=Paraburkholderia humisilvae TaxID=627669 RepID=A0A6J5EYU7_9BURK|nr:hypothetical protein [Paraburkholderia humisilvae]CAB3771254.1 hypothetical protein LMG29542_06576 [Paraburkholderia humisilvae]